MTLATRPATQGSDRKHTPRSLDRASMSGPRVAPFARVKSCLAADGHGKSRTAAPSKDPKHTRLLTRLLSLNARRHRFIFIVRTMALQKRFPYQLGHQAHVLVFRSCDLYHRNFTVVSYTKAKTFKASLFGFCEFRVKKY